jgi:hypothetical protein
MRHTVGRWMREAQLHKYATESMQYCAHRGMAVRNSRGRVKDDAVGASATAEAPELRATMRKLAFLVHPDRFAGMPDAAKENEASLAFLQVGMHSTPQVEVGKILVHVLCVSSAPLIPHACRDSCQQCRRTRRIIPRQVVCPFCLLPQLQGVVTDVL